MFYVQIHGIQKETNENPRIVRLNVKDTNRKKTTPRLIYNYGERHCTYDSAFIKKNKIYFICVFLIFSLQFSVGDPERIHVNNYKRVGVLFHKRYDNIN